MPRLSFFPPISDWNLAPQWEWLCSYWCHHHELWWLQTMALDSITSSSLYDQLSKQWSPPPPAARADCFPQHDWTETEIAKHLECVSNWFVRLVSRKKVNIVWTCYFSFDSAIMTENKCQNSTIHLLCTARKQAVLLPAA